MSCSATSWRCSGTIEVEVDAAEATRWDGVAYSVRTRRIRELTPPRAEGDEEQGSQQASRGKAH